MRHLGILLFSLLLFANLATANLFGQGNLQFNRALKIDLVGTQGVASNSNYTEVDLQTFNIPVGKVWKIESTNANITKGSIVTTTYSVLYNGSTTPVIYMDDVIIYAAVVPSAINVPHQIYWLPAGTHTFSLWLQNNSSPVAWTYTGTITAIEFNIVP